LTDRSPSQFLTTLPEKKKKHVLNYITERRCHKGGYCFYRQEEPNLSDTFFALTSQQLLGIEFGDELTLNFIQNTQRSNGSYFSITYAYYALKSLSILKVKPLYSPESLILNNLGLYDPKNLLSGVSSVFRNLLFVISLMKTINLEIPPKSREFVIEFVLSFQNSDMGFGVEHSTLLETSHAINILNSIDYNFEQLRSYSFIRKCEHSVFGFTNIPSTSLSYLEYLHAGLVISQLLDYEINSFSQCREFVLNCQTNKGGFARCVGGIATLENTFYAVNSLAILESLLM
jgi:hypothetical protein